MPQDNQTGSQTPGSDVLLDTLRRSNITDDQRQSIWNAYHTPGDEKAFVGALNKLNMGDSEKQYLYDMRYKGVSNLAPNQSANPDVKGQVATPAPEQQVRGDVRPSVQSVLQSRATSIGPRPDPGLLNRIGEAGARVFDPLFSHIARGGAAEDSRLLAPEAVMTPAQQGQHPILRASGEFAGSLTTAPNLLMMGGGGVLESASPALAKLLNLGFSSQMIKGAYEQYKPFKDALDRGDSDEALYHLTHGLLSTAFGLHTATEGLNTDPKTRLDVQKQIKADAKEKAGFDPGLNARMREAATKPVTSTQLDPRDSSQQQLQLDFTTKAPDQAHQPENVQASKSANAPFVDRSALIAVTGAGVPKNTSTVEPVPVYAGAIPSEATSTQSAGMDNDIRKSPLSTSVISRPDIQELSRISGLNYKGELVPDTGVHQFEDPAHPGATIAVKVKDIPQGTGPAVDYLRGRMKAKLAENPIVPQAAPAQPSITTPKGPTSFELPAELRANFDRITKLSRNADLAESDKQADELNKQKDDLAFRSSGMLRDHLRSLSGEQLGQLRDSSNNEARQLEAQSKAIKDLTEATIRNRGIKGEIADMRSTGGPLRYVVDPETGERTAVKPDAEISRGARSVFDELQGRVPTSEFSQLKVSAKPEGLSDEEWAQHIDKLQSARVALKRKISDAVTVASETGASLEDMGISEHVDQLKQIESLLGKYTEPAGSGRRPNVPAELDEQGAIKAPEQIKSWTKERAQLALGTKLKSIPTDEEFFQHADMRAEKAQLLRNVADKAQQVLDLRKKQGGFLGEAGVRGEVKRVSLADRVPSDEEVLKRANKAGIYGIKIDDQFGSGEYGFLSKDGKIWLDNQYKNHDEVAEAIMPDTPKGDMWHGAPLRAMMEKGWIRKATPTDYEAWSLDNRTLSTIENDLLRSGRYGREITLDTRGPGGAIKPLTLSDGWGDRYHDLESAVRAEKAKVGWSAESGKVGGTTLATTSTIGGLVGAAVGAHFHEPYAGMIIGWGAGFVGPAMLDRAGFWQAMNAIKPTLTNFGISLHDWLAGPKQLDPVNPDMKPILDAQRRDIRGPVKALVNRLAQLPADLSRRYVDKFVFISDRPTALGKFLMQFDQRGRAFRDLRGKLDVDNSPWVSAWIAAGGGNGWAEAHLLDYKGILKDAQDKQVVNNLNEYLNLKGYQRGLDVMQERLQEHDATINRLNQGLQTPNLPIEVEAGMRKALRETKADRADVINRLLNKEVVPAPYDAPSIARDLKNLETTLGPNKFGHIQALANRVFALNRKILDMVHSEGIITDEAYQKYTGRGDEYIPMQRIYDDLADGIEKTGNKSGSPLYLREQGVIKTLRGSERINRDPIIASADANLEAIREVLRNRVIKDYLKLAQADPQGVGSYFKGVKSGYKAQPNEGLVGVYEGGQQHTFAAPSWLSESLKNVSPATMDMIGAGPLRQFAGLLRSGATIGNLGWSIPNAVRHWGDMALMSEAGFKDVKTLPRDAAALLNEWRKNVYHAAMRDGRYQEYLRSGAAYSTLQRAITPEEHLDLKALGFKQKIASGRVIETVKDFNAMVEDATKMTTYFRLREAGYSEKAAAWETRRYGGGPDFAKQGMNTGFVNLVSMFFNAHLQYVGRAIARSVEQPGRMAVALAAVTAMNMALVQHNISQKDENGNSIWRKVPFTDRENNWVVVSPYKNPITGAPVIAKIPKPSVMKFMSNPIENMLYKMAGAEDRQGSELALQGISSLLPGQFELQPDEMGKSAARGMVSSLNPLMRAPLEEAMNYRTTGTGGSIVPQREQGIDPQFQYSPNASQVTKDIGQGGVKGAVAGGAEGAGIGYLIGGYKGAALGGALGSAAGTFGISPRRAEHIIDTTTAGVGRIATGFVDPFLGGVQQTKMSGPADRLVNAPVVGPITQRFVGSGAIDQQEQRLSQEFYRNAQQAQVPMSTLRFLERNHPEQVERYIRQHQDELWKGKIAVEMTRRLGQIDNAQRTIEQNVNIPDKAKIYLLSQFHSAKLQIINSFNGVFKPSPQVGQAVAFPGQGQGAPR